MVTFIKTKDRFKESLLDHCLSCDVFGGKKVDHFPLDLSIEPKEIEGLTWFSPSLWDEGQVTILKSSLFLPLGPIQPSVLPTWFPHAYMFFGANYVSFCVCAVMGIEPRASRMLFHRAISSLPNHMSFLVILYSVSAIYRHAGMYPIVGCMQTFHWDKVRKL